MCYVKNLRQDVRTLDEMDGLQQLPPIVLADIYLIVCSKSTQMPYNHINTEHDVISSNLDVRFGAPAWYLIQWAVQLEHLHAYFEILLGQTEDDQVLLGKSWNTISNRLIPSATEQDQHFNHTIFLTIIRY